MSATTEFPRCIPMDALVGPEDLPAETKLAKCPAGGWYLDSNGYRVRVW